MLRIAVVVGESSGDILAAGLISKLQQLVSGVEVEGIVGPKLLELGAKQLFPMENLSFMGFIDPILHLPNLYKMRNWLVNYFAADPPDIFIGIDAAEFNLSLETRLHKLGIPIVHYVSPSVWAWRKSRIIKIKRAVDLMLTLFPFEIDIYKQNDIPVKCVGHPAASKIPKQIDVNLAKRQLGYNNNDKLLALLPGSRNSELKCMLPIYLDVANNCYLQDKGLKFIIPAVSVQHARYIQQFVGHNLPLKVVIDKTYQVLSAADTVLVTSGTATLEVMLHKKPMVIAYKTNSLTYHIVRRLIKICWIGLPNILANKTIVPEFIQSAANRSTLTENIMKLLNSPEDRKKQTEEFDKIHDILAKDTNLVAANSVLHILGETGVISRD